MYILAVSSGAAYRESGKTGSDRAGSGVPRAPKDTIWPGPLFEQLTIAVKPHSLTH